MSKGLPLLHPPPPLKHMHSNGLYPEPVMSKPHGKVMGQAFMLRTNPVALRAHHVLSA